LLAFLQFLFVVPAFANETNELEQSVKSLKSLPLESLLNVDVTTVSKRPERLVDSPSAIQVISSEDIRRSGATSLPEALRLAPNLQVAQVDSRQWAISARGFNSTTSDKLLVLIDGRTVYTPLFAGVFWDVQNVMLEDVDRIEVISGPGASLWGANAVNGVVNIISKSARDTQGVLISAGGGSLDHGLGSVRYGDKLGQDFYFRVYGTGFERGNTLLPGGRDAGNDWGLGQGGFRADWLPTNGSVLTLQGDFYSGVVQQPVGDDLTLNGQNILGRWSHSVPEVSETSLQAYWDRTWRRIPSTFSENLNTFDLDFQHRFHLGQRNSIIGGAGYRLMADQVGNSALLAFLPTRRNLQLFSGFVQDEITLVDDRLFLTLGTKLEHNDYSGFEVEPSGRLAWRPGTNQTLWFAVSRAVRSPSRIDTEIFAPGNPPFALAGGGSRFDSEKLLAYELGYRAELGRRVGFSISTFFNRYSDIRSVEPVPNSPGQSIILNGLKAQTYGVELSLSWQPLDWWRLRGGYTYFHKHIFFDGSLDVNHGMAEGNDPHHQFLIQSMFNLPAHFELDSVLRYVDSLDQLGPIVPSYFSLDLRLAWQPTPNWEFALVGQNLIEKRHAEFGAPATRQEIPRSVYAKVTWRF
jgi:iron complex outermembrane receptor protein